MRLSNVLFSAFRFLLPPAIIFSVYLYLYPAVHGCSFPVAKRAQAACYLDQESARNADAEQIAPFRLLALGDPQIEGDSSLPDPNAPTFPSLSALRAQLSVYPLKDAPRNLGFALANLTTKDVPKLFQSYRKRLDLLGNDYYLAHVYRSVRWWTEPTHIAVLGDLLGSQWISDGEFDRRAARFWTRVFKGAEKVPHNYALSSKRAEVVEGREWQRWSNRLINIAGNHDIGYAGDLTSQRVQRFEMAFGSVNWDIRFQLPSNDSQMSASPFPGLVKQPPELKLIVLNSMNLDSPAWSHSLQNDTYDFLDSHIAQARNQGSQDATILLTHIPLYKPAGICVDGPFFDYFPSGNGAGIKEQNHLSLASSEKILDGLFDSGRLEATSNAPGIILNGHDHEGCDVFHYQSGRHNEVSVEDGATDSSWQSKHFGTAQAQLKAEDKPGIREVTVRSMMGSYGGNAGLLSAWFDDESGQWKFEYASCIFGIQHIWWAVHILDLVVIVLGLTSGLAVVLELLINARSGMGKSDRNAHKAKSQ